MKPGKFKLGNIFCSTHTIDQQVEELQKLLINKFEQPRVILTVNAHIYNLACKNARLREILNRARLVTADGMSIVLASRLFNTRIPERCNATEAFRAFVTKKDIPENSGILIGCSADEAKLAAKNIENSSSHCKIINTFSGFLNVDDYVKIFKSYHNIDFIFLGMGSPKTEIISQIASSICPQAIVWGIGGGTIRIFAGTMREAPALIRRIGLQWLHRLYSDPLALWQRYVMGNPAFIWRMLMGSIQFRMTSVFGTVPEEAYSGAH